MSKSPRISCGVGILLLAMIGCGSGSHILPPSITQQPGNQIVPLGAAATFSVVVTGSQPLQYQWSKNGQPIAGATASTFTTSSLTASDAGDQFQVTIKNGAGQAVSSTAMLTLGPRSPKAGDLRFQQVDAASTVNGYQGALGTNFSAAQTDTANERTGAPMSVGIGCYGSHGPQACYWIAQINALPAGVTGLSVSYGHGGHYAELQDGLTQMATDSKSVITGVDINPVNDAYGMSYMSTSTGGGFDLAQYTVPVSGLQAALTAEGAKGRIVTAISWNGADVTFLSYGWTGDTGTVYDIIYTQPTFATADTVAKQLAQAGYIITTCGGDWGTPALWMVGSKVRGDTLPRPILTIRPPPSPQPIADGGYAIVGLFSQDGNADLWIGER